MVVEAVKPADFADFVAATASVAFVEPATAGFAVAVADIAVGNMAAEVCLDNRRFVDSIPFVIVDTQHL